MLRRPLAAWLTEGRVALTRLVTRIRRLALRPLSLLLAKPPEAAQQAPASPSARRASDDADSAREAALAKDPPMTPEARPAALGGAAGEPRTEEAARRRPKLPASPEPDGGAIGTLLEAEAEAAPLSDASPATAPVPAPAAPRAAARQLPMLIPLPLPLPTALPAPQPGPLPPLAPLAPLSLNLELTLSTMHGLEGPSVDAAAAAEPAAAPAEPAAPAAAPASTLALAPAAAPASDAENGEATRPSQPPPPPPQEGTALAERPLLDVPTREARIACATLLEVEAASRREANSRAAALAAATFSRALDGQHSAMAAAPPRKGDKARAVAPTPDRAIVRRTEQTSWAHERRVERRRREMDKAGGPLGNEASSSSPPSSSRHGDGAAPSSSGPQSVGHLGWPPDEYRDALESTLAPLHSVRWPGDLRDNLALHRRLQQLPRRSMGRRHIPQSPERILDAPEIRDDFYMNILDWSPDIGHSAGVVAVALDSEVYLWDAGDGGIKRLLQTQGEGSHVTALAWAAQGATIAVGTSTNQVQLWDVAKGKRVRVMEGHTERVSSLSWGGNVLSSGSRDATIIHHDVRAPGGRAGTLRGHTQEICGLKWSPSGTQLASGGNDNLLHIWDSRYDQPLFRLCQHRAAVRALAWCPWQRGLLASGGGTNDRTIRFWSSASGSCQRSVDAGAQVCALQWAKHDKELVSSLGYSYNEVVIWKYPSLVKVAELRGHTRRVLHMAQSPDGTTLVTAAADETLRFWKVLSGRRIEDDEARASQSVLRTWSMVR